GDLLRAISIWEEALRQDNTVPWVHSHLADGYKRAGNYAGAIQEWKAFLDVYPDYAWTHYHLGLLLMATTPEEALPELMQAAQLDSQLEPTVQGLRTALNTALLSDDRAAHFLVSGRALGALGEWDLAAEAFRNAIAVRSNYAEAWVWLGEARQQQGQDGSLEIEQALIFGPESAMVQGLYGMYLERQGEPEAALAAFHKAADLEPEDPGWQLALGSAYEQTGDMVAAYGYYFQAVELGPADASTWRALAAFSVTYDVDVDVTGLPAARKLVGLAPDDWQSYDLAGQAEFLLEDYTAAEMYLKKAVQMGSTQAAPALHLGLVYMQTGDRSSAYSYLNLARTFDPNGPYGWQAGRLLEEYIP
ncbi:MAG: tetratricopeptide repeat protein, partial [Chloroflexi bacterium]|nr:tetratricopeptide repeat protein [Chloroflexota bacterium]